MLKAWKENTESKMWNLNLEKAERENKELSRI